MHYAHQIPEAQTERTLHCEYLSPTSRAMPILLQHELREETNPNIVSSSLTHFSNFKHFPCRMEYQVGVKMDAPHVPLPNSHLPSPLRATPSCKPSLGAIQVREEIATTSEPASVSEHDCERAIKCCRRRFNPSIFVTEQTSHLPIQHRRRCHEYNCRIRIEILVIPYTYWTRTWGTAEKRSPFHS